MQTARNAFKGQLIKTNKKMFKNFLDFLKSQPKKDKEGLGLKGIITMRHYRGGKLLSEEVFYNTITDMGKDQVAGLINGQRTGAFTRIGLGTSETAAAAGDITLKAEMAAGTSLARAAATCTQVTTDVTNDTARLLHTFTATAGYTIKECGLFNSASGGRILGRKTFAGKALADTDTLQIDYKIDVD